MEANQWEEKNIKSKVEHRKRWAEKPMQLRCIFAYILLGMNYYMYVQTRTNRHVDIQYLQPKNLGSKAK